MSELMHDPEFWDDQARAATILKERSALLQDIEDFHFKEQQVDDLEVLLELAVEEQDHRALKEVAAELNKLTETFRDWELRLLLT
ncbi:MAG: PCRF domain-containing protein, partial [Deltaproteobacteria bacterium]|nr:PCRF domain-containing protein [Deltaproteobacteria bacterium]